jgi:hypothetical protein
MFETMTKEEIVAFFKEKYKVDLVDHKQLQTTIAESFNSKFLDRLNDLDYCDGRANIQTKMFLFNLSEFEDFIQDNPDFNYNKLISGTHDDIDMSAFYYGENGMHNDFDFRDDLERNVRDCTYDFYLNLMDVEDELKLVMIIIIEE